MVAGKPFRGKRALGLIQYRKGAVDLLLSAVEVR